jgi:coproporphyrinogen III oxidase-like Fe-S oxidoreductase
MPELFPPRTCPFCGMPSSVPHETEARCIEALQAEIELTRQMLQQGLDVPGAPPRATKDAPST